MTIQARIRTGRFVSRIFDDFMARSVFRIFDFNRRPDPLTLFSAAISSLFSAVPVVLCLIWAGPLKAADSPQVIINGANEGLRDNILAHLRITAEECSASLVRLQRLSPRVTGNIDNAARALGYYQSRHSHTFSTANGCWQLTVDIEPGNRVALRDVNVDIVGSAETISLFDEVLERTSLQPGTALNQGLYENLKSVLSATAVEYGFFSARFSRSEIALYIDDNVADVHLRFEPGERYRFGQFNIDNRTILSEEFIQRMIRLEEGQPYSSQEMFTLRNELNQSQYFRGINLYPDLGNAVDQSIPIFIELEPRPRHVYSAGVGFTTDTGPRLRLAYDNRYVNRSGHGFESDANFSAIRTQTDMGYSIPLSDPINEKLQLGVGYLGEDTDTYESDRYTFQVNYLKQLSNGWLRDIFINYQLEDYVIEESAESKLMILGGSFSRTKADNPVFTRHGWHLFGELKTASASLMSDTTFTQATAIGKYIRSLGDLRLLSRLEVGATWTAEGTDLPASIRYFAGGDRALRGYKYQALGPVDENGEVVGGTHLIQAGVEFDFPVRDRWRLAAFYDAGNAFNDFDDFELKHTVGLGLRWISPIGPVRVDIAHPLDDGGVRLHITMGPDL